MSDIIRLLFVEDSRVVFFLNIFYIRYGISLACVCVCACVWGTSSKHHMLSGTSPLIGAHLHVEIQFTTRRQLKLKA